MNIYSRSLLGTFSQMLERVAYNDCDSSTNMKKKRGSDAEKRVHQRVLVSSVFQSSLIRRGICCVFSMCVFE